MAVLRVCATHTTPSPFLTEMFDDNPKKDDQTKKGSACFIDTEFNLSGAEQVVLAYSFTSSSE